MRDYVDKITNKFLAWQLPQSVCSDACVTDSSYIYARTGTNLLSFTEARLMVVHLFGELLDEHENLQKFATQYENQCVDLKSELTAAQAEIARLKDIEKILQTAEVERYRGLLRTMNEANAELKSALDVAVEALSSMHIDTPMGWNLDNPENVTYEIAIGWHKSNNAKIEATLDKIKKIKNSTQ